MTAQILALIIFLAMFVLIILEVWDRHLITLGCGLLTLVLVFGLGMRSMSAVWETLNVKSIFTTAFWYAAGESSEPAGSAKGLSLGIDHWNPHQQLLSIGTPSNPIPAEAMSRALGYSASRHRRSLWHHRRRLDLH